LSLDSTHIASDQSLYTDTHTVTYTTAINTQRTKNYCYLEEKFTLKLLSFGNQELFDVVR